MRDIRTEQWHAFTVWVTILFLFRGTEPFDKQGVGLMYSLAGNPLRWDIAVILALLIMTVIYGLYIGYSIWKYVQDK